MDRYLLRMTHFGGRHLIVFSLQVKAHMEALQVENDHLSREIAILRETVKVIMTEQRTQEDKH